MMFQTIICFLCQWAAMTQQISCLTTPSPDPNNIENMEDVSLPDEKSELLMNMIEQMRPIFRPAVTQAHSDMFEEYAHHSDLLVELQKLSIETQKMADQHLEVYERWRELYPSQNAAGKSDNVAITLEAFFELETEMRSSYEIKLDEAREDELLNEDESDSDSSNHESLDAEMGSVVSDQQTEAINAAQLDMALKASINDRIIKQTNNQLDFEKSEPDALFDFVHVDDEWRYTLCDSLKINCQPIPIPRWNLYNIDTRVPPVSQSSPYYKHIEGDGNCGYRVISYAISGDEANHAAFRERLKAFVELEENKGVVKGADWESKDSEHIDSMTDERCWATESDLLLLAYIFRVRIYVFNDYYPAWQLMDPAVLPDKLTKRGWSTDGAIFLHNQGHKHYNVVYALRGQNFGLAFPPPGFKYSFV